MDIPFLAFFEAVLERVYCSLLSFKGEPCKNEFLGVSHGLCEGTGEHTSAMLSVSVKSLELGKPQPHVGRIGVVLAHNVAPENTRPFHVPVSRFRRRPILQDQALPVPIETKIYRIKK